MEAFYSQILNVYSFIIAAIIAIGKHNLSRLHSAVALSLVGSPLSAYLLIYVIRSLFGRMTRLQRAFQVGRGKYLNRALVLMMLPLWLAVLIFTALPESARIFQQAACDSVVASNRILRSFFLPSIVMFEGSPGIGSSILAPLAFAWGVCIFLQRGKIWGKSKIFPVTRMWYVCSPHLSGCLTAACVIRREVVEAYPFVQFCTVILVPHVFWITNVEVGLFLSSHEGFQATYGQVCAESHRRL